MKACAYTNKGPVRSENQDGLYVNGKLFMNMEKPEEFFFEAQEELFIVVDGMGGMGGGGIARDIILNAISANLRNRDNLEREFSLIARKLAKNASTIETAHMGAALAGLWFKGEDAKAFNCGDCRVYQYVEDQLRKITHDHSVVQELVDASIISENEMRFHPAKNQLTAAIGVDDPDPVIFEKNIIRSPNARYLVCSDGLWEVFSESGLLNILREPFSEAAKALYAKSGVASDNFSFILLEE